MKESVGLAMVHSCTLSMLISLPLYRLYVLFSSVNFVTSVLFPTGADFANHRRLLLLPCMPLGIFPELHGVRGVPCGNT